MTTSTATSVQLVPCSVCGRPTNITTRRLEESGCTIATHGTCLPRNRVAGRPGIELVAGDERCDLAYEQQLTDQAREEWEAKRPERDRQREAHRTQLTVGERLDTALRSIGTLSVVGASPVQRESKSADDADRAPGPPRMDQLDVSRHTRIIEHHVRQIERELDAALGLVRPGSDGLMTSEEKDRLIWEEYMGWRAEDVVASAPHLGTHPRTITRSRKREAERRKVKINQTTGEVTGRLIEGA